MLRNFKNIKILFQTINVDEIIFFIINKKNCSIILQIVICVSA